MFGYFCVAGTCKEHRISQSRSLACQASNEPAVFLSFGSGGSFYPRTLRISKVAKPLAPLRRCRCNKLASNSADADHPMRTRRIKHLALLALGLLICFRVLRRFDILELYMMCCYKRPFVMAFGVCGVKGGLSDIISQKFVQRKKEFDLRRCIIFAIVSGTAYGCILHLFYDLLFETWFGSGQDVVTVAKKVFADALIVTPLIAFPCFFVLRAVAESFIATFAGAHRSSATSLNHCLYAGLKDYVRSAPTVLRSYWSIWPVFHFINFAFTPSHLRISAVAMMSFLYLTIFAAQSQKTKST